ncbi:MAG TPA: class I lanthipeptide [Chitinophaga sp.]|uniref:class I lanthipeptide n=1 Tax=Chitinophaga sp. TaxID=1869181 RepID=UPI002BE2CE26|nr:class I lanthipeptide [Chitinophaga sp.]HVI47258.1 class I lanthipeptide [Chitinophaga sp.]
MKRKTSLQKKLSLQKVAVANLKTEEQRSLNGGRITAAGQCDTIRFCMTWELATICISDPAGTTVCA